MSFYKTLVLSAITLLSLTSSPAFSALSSNPVTDPDFMQLPDGSRLDDIRVRGSRLSLVRGTGDNFSNSDRQEFESLYNESKTNPDSLFQWVLMDLDTHQVIDQSLNPQRKYFGASVSKIFVSGALLDWQQGDISSSQKQLMADMLVVSSNTAWTNLQRQIGDGNADLGRERIHNFTQRMGYERTRGFQGWWDDFHGNELTAFELAEFLHDTYKGNYPGAEYNWKIMHACRTGSTRAKKYLPETVFVGGKTGTYHGKTVDPETGKSEFPDGSPYRVRMNSHVVIFYAEGRQYALTVLANTGTNSTAALLAGGLYRRYIADIP